MSIVLDPPDVSLADFLRQLGDVPADRVRMTPPPGTATLADLIAVNDRKTGPACEWVDGTLVEKAMGWYESWLTAILLRTLVEEVERHDLGMVLAPDAVLRILPGIGRAPDVSFIAWTDLPGGRPPRREDRVPAVVPSLAVEVLSETNRPGEMARKRAEYFRAGVARVWEIDPDTNTARVYTAAEAFTDIPADGTLDGEHLLPGFRLSLADLFARADRPGAP